MHTVGYRITLGGLTLDSAADPRTELLEVHARRTIGGYGDRCRIVLHAPPAPQPGLLEQAVAAAAGALGLGGATGGPPAAFEVPVRGEPLQPGDPIVIELSAGAVSETVMTASVEAVRSDFGRTTVSGTTAPQVLAQRRLNRVWLDQTLGGVIRDLASAAGIATGEIETGATYPYVVVHETRTLLDHLLALARREGLDVFADADDRLVVRRFGRQSADYTLHYGIHLLAAEVLHTGPAADAARVEGESPASQRGAARWYWLAQDIAPFRAEVGDGDRQRTVQDAVLRTRDATGARAVALVGAARDQATHARVRLLGMPAVGPGDAVEITGVPKPELNGLFRVAAVEHRFGKRSGYITTLELTGRGGADAAGDLLGGALGALAGAAGL
jgi:phage protein D